MASLTIQSVQKVGTNFVIKYNDVLAIEGDIASYKKYLEDKYPDTTMLALELGMLMLLKRFPVLNSVNFLSGKTITVDFSLNNPITVI